MTKRLLLFATIMLALAGCGNNDPTPASIDVETSSMSWVRADSGPPPPPDHCSDYHNMEAGRGHPVNQHWFNHLDAKGYARVRLACIHRGGTHQWNSLECLWNMENKGASYCEDDTYGWHHTNIPQAKPFSKMRCSSWDHRCQVRWGLQYIADRYGEPSTALARWYARSPHWY